MKQNKTLNPKKVKQKKKGKEGLVKHSAKERVKQCANDPSYFNRTHVHEYLKKPELTLRCNS